MKVEHFLDDAHVNLEGGVKHHHGKSSQNQEEGYETEKF